MRIPTDELVSLAQDLRVLGHDANEAGGRVRIRLPLYCSVTVELDGVGGIRCLPQFGFASRAAATWWTGLGIGLPAAIFSLVDGSVGIGLLVLWLGALAWDVYRYLLTESAISTARSLIIAKYAA